MTREVIVDGCRYVPEDDAGSRIGIGITTHNRPDVFRRAYAEIVRLTPGARIVVVDDASDSPIEEATFRFDECAGIARAKNKCLELLDGCEHIFLWDDDAWPLVEDWWKPYVDSPEAHLMYLFKDKAGNPDVLYQDAQHFAYAESRGVMLYVHRSCIDTVGGMNPEFGRWGWEHPDFSNRIHAAGLTTWRYADVVGSDKLIYSMDETGEATRSVDQKTRNALVNVNQGIHDRYFDLPTRMNYREKQDVVITTLLTAQPDPQRGQKWQPNPAVLSALIKSLNGRKLIVLHDELTTENTDAVEYVRVGTSINPYFQRWVSVYQYLREHPEIDHAFCVDGSDVEMLRSPFDEDLGDALYLGCEQTVVGCEWMRTHHKASLLQEFFDTNHSKQLLNAGISGGTRDTLMQFAHDIASLYFDNHRLRYIKQESNDLGIGDMGAFNYVAYTKYADRIVTGPRVCTTFKANERNNHSWFKHK